MGGAYSGGFAGSLWGLNIKNCYATGDVTGVFASMATFAGTDAPAAYAYGSVTNCYTTGAVVGTASSTYAFAYQDATARSPITNCYFADGNSALKNPNETAEPKTSEEMQTEEFKDTLHAGDPANGWIFREGETPLCGAESADYAAVEAALGKIPADLTAYTDESVEALRAAEEAVIRGKAIAKQAEVDAMAKAIEDAIAALVQKSYPVTISGTTERGTVTVSTEAAVGGSTVTITVKPDSGYTLGGITVTDSEGNELSLTDNGNGAFTFTMPSGKVEIHVTFTEDGSLNPFQDVPGDAYYFEAVNWAVANNVTNGTSETTFSPNVGCTRAQVVTFLWRADRDK